MEKKFTKTEWFDLGYCVAVEQADGISTICEMTDWMGEEEMEANCKLVAAAPDLLRAFEVCYASLNTYGRHPLIERQVEQAIKKATE